MSKHKDNSHKHALTLLAELDAEKRPEQRRTTLRQLRTQFAGEGRNHGHDLAARNAHRLTPVL